VRHAVILAGGSGTRLWPASRAQTPKQLLALGARPGESLLAATARRAGAVVAPERIVVVTAADQEAGVRAALPWLAEGGVIAEPCARNTAAALGLAAVHLLRGAPGGDPVLAALPADHHVADEAELARVMDHAFRLAEQRDEIVTVGIAPTRAETGYGWLELGAPIAGEPGAFAVARFVEKPDLARAEGYLAGGRHLWNGGMFFLRARRLLDELARHLPETYAGLMEVERAFTAAAVAVVYPTLPSVSIDHGVMEKASGVVTVRGDFGWNDVGAWSALADYRAADADGNVVEGNVVVVDGHGNVVIGDGAHAIAVIGLSDVVVVQSGDGFVVVPRERAQEVRKAVDALRARGLDRFL
jgi:mannose-1-phosphate guanylyltransferase